MIIYDWITYELLKASAVEMRWCAELAAGCVIGKAADNSQMQLLISLVLAIRSFGAYARAVES